jgi:hypothetical protein
VGRFPQAARDTVQYVVYDASEDQLFTFPSAPDIRPNTRNPMGPDDARDLLLHLRDLVASDGVPREQVPAFTQLISSLETILRPDPRPMPPVMAAERRFGELHDQGLVRDSVITSLTDRNGVDVLSDGDQAAETLARARVGEFPFARRFVPVYLVPTRDELGRPESRLISYYTELGPADEPIGGYFVDLGVYPA